MWLKMLPMVRYLVSQHVVCKIQAVGCVAAGWFILRWRGRVLNIQMLCCCRLVHTEVERSSVEYSDAVLLQIGSYRGGEVEC